MFNILNDSFSCNFGIPEDELEATLRFVRFNPDLSGYPISILKDWSWWDYVLSEEALYSITSHGVQPACIYSEYLLYDEQERWPLGHCVKTSSLVKFHPPGIFLTSNTLYILVGKGSRIFVSPSFVANFHF